MFPNTDTNIDLQTGKLSGNIIESEKHISELKNVFKDETARSQMPPDTMAYKVQMHKAEEEGKEGGLFFGTSFVYPGLVGNEYFMTRGHFHSKIDTAEYYWCVEGEGVLLLMDEERKCYTEKMTQGSLHYIKGRIAHRIINTGNKILAVGACWPSDAGHDYNSIEKEGFPVRVLCIDGEPTLMKEE